VNGHGGKVAIVTGAARGIGAAIATRLAEIGFAVVINYSTSGDKAAALVAAIGRAVGRGTRRRRIGRRHVALFDAADQHFGGVDVIVNNAGYMALGPIAGVTDATYQRHLSVNLTGTFNGMPEGARRVRDRHVERAGAARPFQGRQRFGAQ
jgi:3-oxoacyl-[acyl-carrier protein] reductase